MHIKRGLWEKASVLVLLVGIMIFGFYFMLRTDPIILGNVVGPIEDKTEHKIEIDKKVEEKFNEKDKVKVIIEVSDNKNEVKNLLKKKKHDFKYFNGFSAEVSKEELEALKNDVNVKKVYYDEEFKLELIDSVKIINADKTWNKKSVNNITGASSVCIIDSGIDYNHDDLKNNYVYGHDFVWDDTDPMDDNGHGTHVSGIVASNNVVIKGVAYNSKVVAMKVCDSGGSCLLSDITAAIEWCNDNRTKYNITAISISLGANLFSSYCDNNYPTLASAVDKSVENNIAVFAASGNGGSTSGISSPACLKNAIPVAASNKQDGLWTGSNRNNLVNIVAPGVSINSTKLSSKCLSGCSCSGRYMICTGTSMATPHAAAASVLLRQYVKENNGTVLKPSEIKNFLKDNGKIIADSGLSLARINVYDSVVKSDNIKPSLNYESPTPSDNEIIDKTWVYVNISSNEKLSNAVLEWNDVNESMDGSYKIFYKNKTNLDRVYYYKMFGSDENNNLNKTAERRVIIYSDAPTIIIKEPANDSLLDNKTVLFKFNVTDDLDVNLICNITINDFEDNLTVVNNSLSSYEKLLNDDNYKWNVECYDNNEFSSNSGDYSFSIDAAPLILNQQPNGTVNNNNVSLNFTTDEISTCKGSVDIEKNFNDMDFYFNSNDKLKHSYSTSLNDGSHKVYSGCSDSSNEISNSSWTFSIESATTTTTTLSPSTTLTTSGDSGSSGGSSSGGGSGESSSIVTTTILETTAILEPTTTLEVTTTTEVGLTNIEETKIQGASVVENEGGFRNIAGNIIKNVRSRPIISSSIVGVVILIGISYLVIRRIRIKQE